MRNSGNGFLEANSGIPGGAPATMFGFANAKRVPGTGADISCSQGEIVIQTAEVGARTAKAKTLAK